MFYSTQILAKKGPLGTIWIAAHLDRRLKRHQIFETNIAFSVDSIINPEAPLALRLSGQLLLGVVKVHSKKVGYLFQDCNDALIKIKQAFKPGDVDLPSGGALAPLAAITLPENYNDLDFLGSLTSEATLDPIDPEAPVRFTLGQRESFMLADDISALLGSQSSLDGEERFELSGDELERSLSASLGEPERLRRAATPGGGEGGGAGALYGDDSTPGGGDGGGDFGDERMDAPPDDIVDRLLAPGGRPASVQDWGADGAEQPPVPTPATTGLDGMDDLDMPDAGLEPEALQLDLGLQGAPDAAPPPPPAAHARERRRRVQLDVGPENRPATALPGAEIRALLADRGPLLRPRAPLLRAGGFSSSSDMHAVTGVESALLAESALLQPLAYGAAAGGPLADLFARRFAGMDGGAAGPSKRRKKKDAAAALEEEEERQAEEQAALDDGGAGAQPANDPDGMHFGEDFGGGGAGEAMQFEDQGMGDDGAWGGNGATPGQDAHGSDLGDGLPNTASTPNRSHRSLRSADGGGGAEAAAQDGSWGEADAEVELGEEDRRAFTGRTLHVVSRLKAGFAASGKKKRRLSGGGAAVVEGALSADGLVEGKSRIDACRWFFELLVLKNKDYVDLAQAAPYADIRISQRPKLVAI